MWAPTSCAAYLTSSPGSFRRVSIWVVKSSDIVASQEEDAGEFFDPMDDKPYRHATHYRLPEEVDNM